MFLFSLCLIGEWGGERLWGGVRDGGWRRILSIVVFFSRGGLRGWMVEGSMRREREREQRMREREREGKGEITHYFYYSYIHYEASIATIFATICCGATIVCCHL